MLPPSLAHLVESLQILPGVGEKTAQRLAFFLIRGEKRKREQIGNALLTIGDRLRKCQRCFHFCESNFCDLCERKDRDTSLLCIVEESLDLLAVEKTGAFSGYYHVLGGALAPLDGITVSDLHLEELFFRLKNEDISEIFLATNPSLEGESTAMLISRKCVTDFPKIKITRLASGIPCGGDVEYADELTLRRAVENRRDF